MNISRPASPAEKIDLARLELERRLVERHDRLEVGLHAAHPHLRDPAILPRNVDVAAQRLAQGGPTLEEAFEARPQAAQVLEGVDVAQGRASSRTDSPDAAARDRVSAATVGGAPRDPREELRPRLAEREQVVAAVLGRAR